MSRAKESRAVTGVSAYDHPTNPAERWLNARQDLAEAKALGRKGPLFERATAGRAEEAQRRMDAAYRPLEAR